MTNVEHYPGRCVHAWSRRVDGRAACLVPGCTATCLREGGVVVEYELILPRPVPRASRGAS